MALCIVTGGNIGLGFETAKALLEQGHQVVISSRSQQRAEAAIARISPSLRSAIDWLPLDLSSRSSIDGFAANFAQQYGQWDILVNNAGAKVLKDYSTTDFSIEYHYGVNAVGHFAITLDLLGYRSAKARVVSVSSIVARFAPLQLRPIVSESQYRPGSCYALSKLSNLLFAIELNNRVANLVSVAAHPGFARAEPYGPAATKFFEAFLAQSAKSGAAPIVAAALGDYPSGTYLGPKYLELWGEPKLAKIPDVVNRERLLENWAILEELSNRKLAS